MMVEIENKMQPISPQKSIKKKTQNPRNGLRAEMKMKSHY